MDTDLIFFSYVLVERKTDSSSVYKNLWSKKVNRLDMGHFLYYLTYFQWYRQDHSTYIVILKGLLLLPFSEAYCILKFLRDFFLNFEELIRMRFH